jgi:YD repeat-containing protein
MMLNANNPIHLNTSIDILECPKSSGRNPQGSRRIRRVADTSQESFWPRAARDYEDRLTRILLPSGARNNFTYDADNLRVENTAT